MVSMRSKVAQRLAAVVLYGILPYPIARAAGGAEWGGNLVLNSSFEEGKSSWQTRRAAELPKTLEQLGKANVATIMLDDAVAHSGHFSLRIVSDASTTLWHAIESDPIGVRAGRRYKLTAWIKTEDVAQEGEQYYNSNVYVRFVDESGEEVKIGKVRVRATERLLGTNAWTNLEQLVRVPEGAELAYVGCVLTCSGKAWFDDVELHPRAELPWKKRETDRFVLYFEGPDAPSDDDVADLESHLRKIEQALGISHPGKIPYYRYSSKERKEALTGNGANAHFEGGAVHADSWKDRHEIVHVIDPQLGKSVVFLKEGLAVHLAGAWGGQDLHSYTKLLANKDELLPIGQLLDDVAFRNFPPEVTYPQAGSFVRYLIELFGVDRFKKLYPIEDSSTAMSTLSEGFIKLYGLSIQEAEQAWQEFLVPPGSRPKQLGPGIFKVAPDESGAP